VPLSIVLSRKILCWDRDSLRKSILKLTHDVRKGQMTNRKSILCVLGLMPAFILVATAAEAPKLTFTFTKNNVPGAMQTFPGGVNNAGVKVGQFEDKNSAFHGYILKGKKVTQLDDPNGTATSANNVNPGGAISVVGLYLNSSGAPVGFLYKDGKYTDIPGPKGSTGSSADAINDAGAIVGYYLDSSGIAHGFLFKGKKYTTLDVPGATATLPTGINTRGWICAQWADSRGALQSSLTKNSGKTYKNINVPGATESGVLDLNAAGDVSYLWLDASGATHGALLHGGKYYKYDYPKAVFTYGGGINDQSVITGGFQTTRGGPMSGFKATYK
jgi:uncharacterized membrane protein